MSEILTKLFSQKTCERCGADLKERALSFNTDEIICPTCKEKESNEPFTKLNKAAYMRSLYAGTKKKKAKTANENC